MIKAYGLNWWKNLKALLFGIFLALLLCEIILRIYNPFPFSVQRGKIVLPANQSVEFSNTRIAKLDKKIRYSRNALGFRGPELPSPDSGWIKIITIGGSTTASSFQSDSCTWPFLLSRKLQQDNPRIWLNNAGLDGHSSFGHLLLLREYVIPLHPDYAIFLMGINDTENDRADEYDRMNEKKINTSSIKGFLKSLMNFSELGRTVINLYYLRVAHEKGLTHREVRMDRLVENPLPDSIIQKRMAYQAPFLEGYRKRTNEIMRLCDSAGITPVFVTQPSLFGAFEDPATGLRLGDLWTDKDPARNGIEEEKVLELYNDVLRADSSRIKVIDLAVLLPKNSTYYYDFIHFTNEGARVVADIMYRQLQTLVHRK